jgi:CHAT domain-containing protein
VLRVLVAAQGGKNSGGLPPLSGAHMEAQQIEPALAAQSVHIEEDPTMTRGAVLGAFGEPGAWVHVAAHGMVQPQRIGYSGIWLEPTEDEPTPPFLSWLDVLDSGAQADLVVLNACRLADSGNVVGANLSFAGALVRAGARHVVAAAWPVSDSASALWVPAFYSALLADPRHDPAEALRHAQLRLRESRAFVHPFFWASLQTLERLSIPPPPPPAPGASAVH